MLAIGLLAVLLALVSSEPKDAGSEAPAFASPAGPAKPTQAGPGWNEQRSPATGLPGAIGACNCGCLQGAAILPASGPGYEVLRLGRNRRFGHPALIAFVRGLGAAAKARHLGLVVVGDLSQPRGGPTPSGHRSHQSGLDVDVGYAAPAGVRANHVSLRDRERVSPLPVVDLVTHEATPFWGPRVIGLLALAASDPVVDRIFVNPAVKRMLCSGKTRDAPWSARIRPWWGHHDHFHVRLKCPPDSPLCVPQEPPSDDGCGVALAWWFSPDAEATRSRRKQTETEEPAPKLPDACAALLDGQATAPSP